MSHNDNATTRDLWLRVALLVAAVLLWRLAAAWLLPVTRDEAYYFDWARSLAWGYFDHPPGVAFLGLGTWLEPSSALAGRLGTIAASILTLVVLASLYRNSGLRGRDDLLTALVLALATLPGLASGLVATPDTLLALAWVLTLHEALAALRGERRRWLTAGLATGAGLLGKYTMVLIGPVLLWAILRTDPRALRTPWPWLGGLLALLVFAPHLVWNADNEWLTMRFQLGHGLSTDTGTLIADPLPPPVAEPTPPAPEATLTLAERATSVLGYLGTQIALWGLIALPLLAALLARRGRPPLRAETAQVLDPRARSLLGAAALFPLGFFAVIASFSEVEPNWPAMYLFAAAPFAALALRALRKWALAAAGVNVLLVSLYVLHAATGVLPLPDSQQRVLRETHGYRELAASLGDPRVPVLADRYQIAAMLRFYRPGLGVTQWPGITRPSEYLRGRIAPPFELDQLRAEGFLLVTRKPKPPRLPGFMVSSKRVLYDCPELGVVQVQGEARPCARPLHQWRVFGYEAEREQAP